MLKSVRLSRRYSLSYGPGFLRAFLSSSLCDIPRKVFLLCKIRWADDFDIPVTPAIFLKLALPFSFSKPRKLFENYLVVAYFYNVRTAQPESNFSAASL